jgi:cell division protein FtsB
MKDLKVKGKWRRIFQSKPVLALMGLLILLFAWNIIGFVVKMRETAKNKNIAENKIIELGEMKSKLSSDIEKLKTEKGIEENIREKFGLAKDGEQLIVVVEDKNQLIANPKDGGDGLFSWFKNLFK